MVRKIKNALYFSIARYFRFFARIRLARWNPRIVVITGSNGKTATLHLLETQMKRVAKYSHHANSSFGIPFDILGLKRTTYSPLEWIWLFFLTPLRAWQDPYQEKIYVVEADCDRPGEGDFLSSLLMPEITIWLSSARTHSKNFEKAVRAGTFGTIEEAIAYEFGFFLQRTSALAIVNTDNPLINKQLGRAETEVCKIIESAFESYDVTQQGSTFGIHKMKYHAPFLLPRETLYSISAAVQVANYFGISPTTDLSNLIMPPGRSSVFKGIKNTTIIDSSYNANFESVQAILAMIEKLPSDKKWIILGDLTEQGEIEKEEHEKIAQLLVGGLLTGKFQKIILVGPRLAQYALPILKASFEKDSISFISPREALDYLVSSIVGGEMLVFKGARFLEGIIEHLLENKKDADKLCRREDVWQARRKKWGL